MCALLVVLSEADGTDSGCEGLPRSISTTEQSPVYSHSELGGQGLGFLPGLALAHPDRRLSSLK